jgi:type II secretory pathway pseudopilin PulG
MRHPSGFTLLETMIVIAFLSGVGIALSYSIYMFYRQNSFVFETVAALDYARSSVNTALKNIRESSFGEDGAYPIGSVGTSSITFHAEVDGDYPVEKVKIWRVGQTLYKVVQNSGGNPPTYVGQSYATSTLATYVSNSTSTPLFRYYNGAGVELQSPVDINEIASILVRVDVDLNPLRAPDIFTLSGTITLRNLKNPYE